MRERLAELFPRYIWRTNKDNSAVVIRSRLLESHFGTSCLM
jgi:hypothetical protein